MNIIKDNIKLIIKIINILIFFIPIFYLVYTYIKKRKRKKRIMIGHYLIAIILMMSMISIKWGVTKIKNNIMNDYPVNSNSNYVGTTSKGYIINKNDGAYYIDDYLIVNKSYPLDENWKPKNTYEQINDDICKSCIDKVAFAEWLKMKSDAAGIGLNIYIASGYRSYDYQDGLYKNYVLKDGKNAADTYSARPGHSEHQSGLAFDLNTIDSSFAATDEGKWVENNAYIYGFIIRFPKDKSKETGYKYEPWHLRYVGVDLAKKLYNNGKWITMESYFGIDSKYQ